MRRLAALAAAIGIVALAAGPGAATAAAQPPAPPSVRANTTTPVKHFVMLMQANHSFDNYFGSYPGADGVPPDACLPLDTTDRKTEGCVKPYRLGGDPPEVLDRTAAVQGRQFDGGRMDGFVSAYRRLGRDGTTTMGYYDSQDLPFYWNVADEYTLFDAYFSSARVGARNNALYWVAGVPAPNGSERVPVEGYGDVPTIFDQLDQRGVSWKFYVENYDPAKNFRSPTPGPVRVPLLSFARFVDDPRLAGHIVDLSEYYRDLDAGTLPAVSYVASAGSSENPPARVSDGQTLVRNMVAGLAKSQYWSSSAFMWTYNGWGGWYDHVAPPAVDDMGLGFRVPALLVSPYSRRGFIDHTPLDYTSALRFIEDNWTLPRLGSRDTASPGLASAFDFGSPPRPPQLLGLERTAPPVGIRARWVVYSTYGSAVLVAVSAAVVPGLLRRRRDRAQRVETVQ